MVEDSFLSTNEKNKFYLIELNKNDKEEFWVEI